MCAAFAGFMDIQKTLAFITWPYSNFSNVKFSWGIIRQLPAYNNVLNRSFPKRKRYPLKGSRGVVQNYSYAADVLWQPYEYLRRDVYETDSSTGEAIIHFRQVVDERTIYQKNFSEPSSSRTAYEVCRCSERLQGGAPEFAFFENMVNNHALRPFLETEVVNPRPFLFTHQLSFAEQSQVLNRQAIKLKAVPLELETNYPCEEYLLIADHYFLYIDVETGLLLQHESFFEGEIYEVAAVSRFEVNIEVDKDLFHSDDELSPD